ncbi:MAG TPA: DUF4062 domain-containing protein, partial [Thermoanaerobaculia bacterium]
GVALTVNDVDEIVDEMRKRVQALFRSRMELEPRSVGIGFRENLDQVVHEQRHELILAMKRAELDLQFPRIAHAQPNNVHNIVITDAPASAPLRVFLCSTYTDLAEERALVLEAIRLLRLQHVSMEFFGARPELPLETCLAEVRQSNLVLVVVGSRYGTLVPGSDISYSHAEYEEAFRLNKPVHAYIRPNDAEEAPHQEPEQQRRLAEFKALLMSRHTVAPFRDGHDLSLRVAADISRVLTSGTQGSTTSEEAKRPFRTVLNLIIRKVEALLEQDLVSLFQQADRGRWPTHNDIAPDNLYKCIQLAQEFDADLYEHLIRLNAQFLDSARLTLSRMAQKANDFWEQHAAELSVLETEFRNIASEALVQARAALRLLDSL